MNEEELAALEAATAATAAAEPAAAVDPEHEAAVLRGDVYVPPGEEAIDPALLAEIAGTETLPVTPEVRKEEGTVPLSRLNEVLEKNRLLKEQLEASKGPSTEVSAGTTPPADDSREKIRELRRQQENLRIEGDLDAANELGDQIDDLLLQAATATAEKNIKQGTSQQNLKTSLEAVGAAAYEKYPFLDVNSDAVDMDAVSAVKSRRDELIQGGILPVDALQMAVEEKGPKFTRLLGTDVSVKQLTPDQIRAERERTAQITAANASILQPSLMPNKSEKDSFAVNVADLTPAQIKAMPEDQKARLRGDIV